MQEKAKKENQKFSRAKIFLILFRNLFFCTLSFPFPLFFEVVK